MKSIECPYCDGKAELNMEKSKKIFLKKEVGIDEYYYKCEKCKKEFTTTELDTININQIYKTVNKP